ncbi:30S ribosomal protein S2 [Candidatus Micrarchaeota archaeon]|nr:30S ribosomal protein S2 [Candidatus Micrarchaeota archaeon]
MEIENKSKEKNEKVGLLVSQDIYLKSGIHIGTKIKTGEMKKFIYRRRGDGLYILDLKSINERLLYAAKELARYEPEDILVTASRIYSASSAAMFCKLIGARLYPGRFIPGVLTNPTRFDFIEPKIMLVSDPRSESRAVEEAGKVGVPVLALCDTDNSIKNIDWVVPCNNKGRRALALIYYILAREYLISKGIIASHKEFKYRLRDFEDGEVPQEVIDIFKANKGKPGKELFGKKKEIIEEETEKQSEKELSEKQNEEKVLEQEGDNGKSKEDNGKGKEDNGKSKEDNDKED